MPAQGTRSGLWLSFKRHVRLLRETGFVAQDDRLTADGRWAAQLRLDQPLLIAEAIRKGAFNATRPEGLAGGLAPFVWDKAQEVALRTGGRVDLSEPLRLFECLLEQVEEIRVLKQKRGFENPLIMFWPSAALYLWARGVPWDRLLEFVPVDEGDMASLIMRTADHLRQVTSLRDTHPLLASVAEEAIVQILREPVYID